MAYILHYPGLDKYKFQQELTELSEKEISVMSDITIVTVATDDVVDTSPLIYQLTKSGVSFVNAEDFRSDKTTDFTMITKISDYVEALKTITTPYVLLLDSLDVVFLDNIDDTVLEIFAEMGGDIVYNATYNRFPKSEVFEKEKGFCTHFLNAGVCLGKTAETLAFYERVLELAADGVSTSEQHYVKTAWQEVDNVVIDEEQTLFQCHKNKFKEVNVGYRTQFGIPIKLLSTVDTDYYSVLFSELGEREVTCDADISIVLLADNGTLKDQLDSNGINYVVVKDNTRFSSVLSALESIDTAYAVVCNPQNSVLIHSLDATTIDALAESGCDVVFGALTARENVTDAERLRANDKYIAKFPDTNLYFGKVDRLKEMLSLAAQTEDDTTSLVLRDLWLSNGVLGTDGRQDIFACVLYNDADIHSEKSIFMHSAYPWISKNDGWCYIE